MKALNQAAYSNDLAEQARQMQNRYAQGYSPYGQAIPKPEGGLIQNTGSRRTTIEELCVNAEHVTEILKTLSAKLVRTESKVDRLSGFYHWVTEVHPELAAQYKAMRDLYDAANNTNDVETQG